MKAALVGGRGFLLCGVWCSAISLSQVLEEMPKNKANASLIFPAAQPFFPSLAKTIQLHQRSRFWEKKNIWKWCPSNKSYNSSQYRGDNCPLSRGNSSGWPWSLGGPKISLQPSHTWTFSIYFVVLSILSKGLSVQSCSFLTSYNTYFLQWLP